jgi:UDP-N-acetylglucosamine transferase subunit ALG13
MILLTVGTQLPFDRLVRAVDYLAPELDEPVIAQIGKSTYQPKNIQAHKSFTPFEFEELLKTCRVIISHAGIGTVLNAQKYGKPIILFPRRAEFNEHRNNHQLATCESLSERIGIYVTVNLEDLTPQFMKSVLVPASPNSENTNRKNLISSLRNEIVK